ncbi:VOC family protein [Nocardia caishijiensis]|uniref:Glyoxalase superfamily protein PhnB n=1 Tax=Nocardia caishijiensis TaxID=184756 RepID=A0ABQ6YHG2_9NOCA|nr:VOC family protein [Nocardia caishijiensis]KAF0845088.1 putative glyoxalase superfamily protein PhnB [Nocardia caishijiensis]
MNESVAPIPEGYHSITCFLAVADGDKAIDFYTEVFGATLLSRADGPDGQAVHAELLIGDSTLQLGIPLADGSVRAPQDWVHTSIVHYCPDVDDAVERAVDRGARVVEETQTFVTGDRYGVIIDPFGHRWAVMTRVENVSREEADRRIADWMATQSE